MMTDKADRPPSKQWIGPQYPPPIQPIPPAGQAVVERDGGRGRRPLALPGLGLDQVRPHGRRRHVHAQPYPGPGPGAFLHPRGLQRDLGPALARVPIPIAAAIPLPLLLWRLVGGAGEDGVDAGLGRVDEVVQVPNEHRGHAARGGCSHTRLAGWVAHRSSSSKTRRLRCAARLPLFFD